MISPTSVLISGIWPNSGRRSLIPVEIMRLSHHTVPRTSDEVAIHWKQTQVLVRQGATKRVYLFLEATAGPSRGFQRNGNQNIQSNSKDGQVELLQAVTLTAGFYLRVLSTFIHFQWETSTHIFKWMFKSEFFRRVLGQGL